MIIQENQRNKLKQKGVLVKSEIGTGGGMTKSSSTRDLARTMNAGTSAHSLGLESSGRRERGVTPTGMHESYYQSSHTMAPLIDSQSLGNHRGTVAPTLQDKKRLRGKGSGERPLGG
jgi:hypothetical protein